MRAGALSLVVCAALPALGALLAAPACGRRAELPIEEQPDSGHAGAGGSGSVDAGPDRPEPPESGVPLVEDSGLSLDAGQGCGARPIDCPSLVDFPCGRQEWFSSVIDGCRTEAGCVSGWLRLEWEGEGCVSNVGVTEPNAPFVACLVRSFQHGRCPCVPGSEQFYLGDSC